MTTALPLNVVIEIWIVGTGWVDITSDVRGITATSGGGITITRGRLNESTRTVPGRAALVIDNLTGDYSPRNPTGTYYELIGRNTPLRITLPDVTADNWLTVQGEAGAAASTPDHASLDITGDLDVRADLALWDWFGIAIAGKYATSGDQRSWVLRTSATGYPQLFWSPDGTSGAELSATSTDRISTTPGERVTLRATLDVDNGASGWTVTFYTGADGVGTTSWTQLGNPVTDSGVTSVHSGTATMQIGDLSNLALTHYPSGRIYGVQLRSGIAGTVVANPDWTSQDPGTTSFTDSAGRTWTVATTVATVVEDPTARIHAEITAWPPRWATGGGDRWAQIEAYGILRRLGQGRKPLQSPITRHLLTNTLVGYWTLETGAGSALDRGITAELGAGVTFEADTTLPGSSGVAVLGDDTASVLVTADSHTITDDWSTIWYLRLDTLPASTVRLANVYTNGSGARRWEIDIETDGSFTFTATNGKFGADRVELDSNTASIYDNTAVYPLGSWVAILLEIFQDGSDLSWEINWNLAGSATTHTSGISTISSDSGGQVRDWLFPASQVLADAGCRIAHPHIASVVTTFGGYAFAAAGNGYVGESAADRAIRLADEEGLTLVVVGDPAKAVAMGAQPSAILLDLLQECADADGGILHELRGALGLALRTGASLYNRTGLTLDYVDGVLSPPVEPTDDDQATRNDITVMRPAGGSYRAVQTSGPLNINNPEDDADGVGVYDTQVTRNLATDALLRPAATWLLAAGTQDEARYPRLHVDLTRDVWRDDDALTAQMAAVDSGSLLVLDGLPAWLPPGPTDQLVQGYTEVLAAFDWTITPNATPGGLYRVGVMGTSTRLSPSASRTTASFVSGTDTSMTVERVDSGTRLWITSGDFPFDVLASGVRLTVTAISGTGDPQTMTITQTPVNGVIKTIPSGSAVTLAEPWRLAR